MLQSKIHASILGICVLLTIHYVSAFELDSIPSSLSQLLGGGSDSNIVLTKRIASVRSGDQIQVGIDMSKKTSAVLNPVDVIAAVYSASDGSLVRVLDKKLVQQTTTRHSLPPSIESQHSILIRVSTVDLCARKPFEVYKLALVVPEKDSSGVWTSYAVATMLFAYVAANDVAACGGDSISSPKGLSSTGECQYQFGYLTVT